jgi:hypothetical protein
MAIKIEFDRRKVFWQIVRIGRQVDGALAFEACAILFTQLQESVSRLQDTLLNYSAHSVSFDAFVALGDIYQIIDISHRIHNLYPLLLINSSLQAQESIDTIAALHGSFESLPSLLSDFIANNSNAYSVLGDFQWRYRAALQESATVYVFKGGCTLPQIERQL